MISNNIKKRLKQLKLYDTNGNQTMLDEDTINILINQIPEKALSNPKTTYCDPQCGTGTIMLKLADVLMDKLTDAIPDEKERLEHIFTNQIFLSDTDSTQILLASSNLKKAINNNQYKFNIFVKDCFKIHTSYDYVLSNLDFDTIKNFVPKWRGQCKKLIITGRANKNCYTDSQIHQLTSYRYLDKSVTDTLVCMMVFEPVKKNKVVEIIGNEETILVDNPPFLPDSDINSYRFALEVINRKFKTYSANYGSYYRNSKQLSKTGKIPLIFSVGKYGEDFRDIVYASKKVITPSEGVGKHKVVISKNGLHKRQSVVKYAGPEFGTGHNTLWLEINKKEDYDDFLKYYTSPAIVTLCKALKATMPANGTTFWKRLPTLDNYDEIERIYDKYYK